MSGYRVARLDEIDEVTDGREPWRPVRHHFGITAFGIDMRGAGVEVRPLVQMNGDSHFSQVFLDGAFVPDGDRIGDEGSGWSVATTTLMHERASIGGWGGVSPADLVERARRRARVEEARHHAYRGPKRITAAPARQIAPPRMSQRSGTCPSTARSQRSAATM